MDARVDVPADPGFVRTLGAAEEGLDTLETVKARCHIVRVIAYEGVLDTELFERALRHTLDRRVLANTRIVRPPGAVPYFARSERPPEFSVVDRVDTEHSARGVRAPDVDAGERRSRAAGVRAGR